MFKPSSLPWPVSRDRGLMYFCIYVYVPCAVLWLLSLLFPLVSLCVFIYVRTPGCFGSQRDCNPEVFLRWKLPHLPLISHRQLQLMASFRAPYLRVWLSQTHQDCRDSYSLKTSLWKGLRGHRFVCLGPGCVSREQSHRLEMGGFGVAIFTFFIDTRTVWDSGRIATNKENSNN